MIRLGKRVKKKMKDRFKFEAKKALRRFYGGIKGEDRSPLYTAIIQFFCLNRATQKNCITIQIITAAYVMNAYKEVEE